MKATILAPNTLIHLHRAITGEEEDRLILPNPMPCKEYLCHLARWRTVALLIAMVHKVAHNM